MLLCERKNMDNWSSRDDKPESILQDGSSGPCSLPLEYLRKITNNFSNGQLLGVGGFGKVYKGVRQNGECIAVKKLDQSKATVQKPQFENEVYHLMRLKHPNIVRFVGYCYETRSECVFHDGKYVFAEMPQKLVCLECLPNGSLDSHLSDESSGLGWYTRHRIIRGTCFGLHYLHEECKSQFNASIIHMDLKPANILLDDNMVPKIADFGLSKLFDTGKTQTCTTSPAGSFGYMAPEYIYLHTVSTKADIYSLGAIIIEVITGRKFGPSGIETSCKDFVEPVLKNWRNRLEATPTSTSPETDCQQIEICLEIGLSCTNFDPGKRPTMTKIIKMLNRCESTNCDEERLAANQDNLRDMTKSGNIYNPNCQQVSLPRNEPSPSYNMDSNRNALQQYAQGPSDRHIEKMYHGSNFQQDTGGTTPSNYFKGEGRVDGDSQLYQPDGDALPGIEGFQIAGEPRPGFRITACGFPTNGTTRCNFQWVRHFENGIRQSIEGATMYDYVITADDVGTRLAVDCTLMDDNCRQDSNRNALQQYVQGPSDRHIEQMYHGSNFQQDTGGTTPSNYFEGEGRVDGDSQLYQPDGDALPGIEGFQIAGKPRLGSVLTACGFPTNGTTLCNFQWVRHLENGTRQSIEGATMYDYVVIADDVGTLLAVDCTPLDDNGRQGDLVTEFANNGNKITCDPEMQSHIDAYVSTGRAEFEVYVLKAYSPDEWESATLVLTRPNFQIFTKTSEVIIDEKYSQSLQMKIPNGRTTQCVLVTASATLPLNTHGISENEDYNVRLRDLIVLVMRTFQKKGYLVEA